MNLLSLLFEGETGGVGARRVQSYLRGTPGANAKTPVPSTGPPEKQKRTHDDSICINVENRPESLV